MRDPPLCLPTSLFKETQLHPKSEQQLEKKMKQRKKKRTVTQKRWKTLQACKYHRYSRRCLHLVDMQDLLLDRLPCLLLILSLPLAFFSLRLQRKSLLTTSPLLPIFLTLLGPLSLSNGRPSAALPTVYPNHFWMTRAGMDFKCRTAMRKNAKTFIRNLTLLRTMKTASKDSCEAPS